MDKPLWVWILFFAVVLILLVLDLGLLHKKQREISVKESMVMSGFYILMALLFGKWIWWSMGSQAAIEFYTGYFIEKSLSIDNVFVISMIFTYFSIPRLYQHRVLFWGILGVILLRGIMIGVGAAMIAQYSWVLYIFGVFLIGTGIKMLFMPDKGHGVDDNPILKFLKRHLRVTSQLHGQKFWVKLDNLWHATPLFFALIMVEFADVVFAVDSIPAVFAVTLDPYIVYTSNIFAILGLRALYFALAAILHRFEYLKYSLALVLIFIGGKIFYSELFYKIPAILSLGVTISLLGGGVVYSLWKTRQNVM